MSSVMCMYMHRYNMYVKDSFIDFNFSFEIATGAPEAHRGGHRHWLKNKKRGDKTAGLCIWCHAPRG